MSGQTIPIALSPPEEAFDAVNKPTEAIPVAKTFQSLPHDVKSCIIEQIKRPSELKKICLVSKEFHGIAVRFLYHRISLDLGSFKDNLMPSFLSPHNIGLKYIRQVHLYLAHVTDRCNQEQQATLTTRMLLEFLPENILEEFRCGFMETWCPWRPFSADNLMLLYRRQKKMKWLEAMDMDRSILPELKKNPAIEDGLFDNARTLALYPENRDSLKCGGYYVEKTKDKLEELIVHTRFMNIDDSSPVRGNLSVREVNDTATGPGLLTSTLFAHMLPFESCTPFANLTSLRLHEVNLRYCADNWCKAIEFRKVQNLRVFHCPGVDALLGQLSRAAHLPKRLRVFEIQHEDNSDQETLIALDGFLCLTSGLTDLLIDLVNVRSMPGVAGIVRHGQTLETLNIHCTSKTASNPIMGDVSSDPEELVFDTENFEKLCSSASELEQLSCAWPDRSLVKRLVHEDWCSFERSVSKLRKLVTLQITTWPSNKPGSQVLPRSIYEQLIQGVATHLFESAAKRTPSPPDSPALTAQPDDAEATTVESAPLLSYSRLRLIAFGISDKIYEREDSRNQLLYLKSSAFDAEGGKIIYAAPVGWLARQYLEPRSEILDFVLSREARLPCRGERGDMDGRFGFTVDEDDL